MEEYLINCALRDKDGNITHVCIENDKAYSKYLIARIIMSGKNSFFIYKHKNKVKVDVKSVSDHNNSTSSIQEFIDIDELDFLPTCNLSKL